MKLSRYLFVGVLGAMSFAASAQSTFPSAPIRLVVPFAPGGSTDQVARVIGKKVSDLLKQPIVIDNKPGANTIIGTEFVARARPDGYTLVLATNGHTSNSSLYPKLPYDAEKDFAPVAYIGSTPNVIAVNQSNGAKSLQDLIQMVRSNPGTIDFATAGHGTTQHFSGEMLNSLAKVDLKHVPYKGGGPAAADVIAGHVPVLISGLPPAMPFINAGRLIPLAVTSMKRSPILPNVPTVAEVGFSGFDSSFWFAVLAPRDTPQAIVQELNKVFNDVLKSPDVQKQFAELGVDIGGGSALELAVFLKTDTQKWAKLIKSSGIKLME
jgi:tripartite-type tricarboxylate transporter receptor subunit TctC